MSNRARRAEKRRQEKRRAIAIRILLAAAFLGLCILAIVTEGEARTAVAVFSLGIFLGIRFFWPG